MVKERYKKQIIEAIENSYNLEALKNKFETLSKELSKFKESLDSKKDLSGEDTNLWSIMRDSRIRRFQYSAEFFWKVSKTYLRKLHCIDEYSPVLVMKGLFKTRIVSEIETEKLLEIMRQRINVSHMYHEDLAENLDDDLEEYYKLIQDVSERLKQKIDSQ